MTNSTRRLVRQGDILPPLTLEDGDNRLSVPGNQATVLVLTHRDCRDCAGYLTEVGAAVGDLKEWATRLIGVLPGGDPPADRHPFPVVVDGGGKARSRLGLPEDQAAVILADRWGEVFEVATFDRDHQLPLPSQLVESAKIVDMSCGECNVPGPEWREADD